MTILFGTNSYLLKSVSPVELGMQLNAQSDLRIEYRQRYFHLFFIPFFPIGRIWSVRQGGKLYHASAELEQALQGRDQAGKNGIWAWSGPLLGIAILLIVSLVNNMEEREWRSRSEKNKAVLSAFFQDKSKTEPLKQKLATMSTLIDSSLAKVKYDRKPIDTSMNKLLSLYLEAKLTQTDSLTGYNETNTFVITDFRGSRETKEIIGSNYKTSLDAGEWQGYGDTSSVFVELRKLEHYKYILVLKEYNRAEPHLESDSYTSGYLLVSGTIISIETGQTLKNFKLLVGNSDKVSHYSSSRNYSGGSSEWKRELESDLNFNVMKAARKYVFGEEAYSH